MSMNNKCYKVAHQGWCLEPPRLTWAHFGRCSLSKASSCLEEGPRGTLPWMGQLPAGLECQTTSLTSGKAESVSKIELYLGMVLTPTVCSPRLTAHPPVCLSPP